MLVLAWIFIVFLVASNLTLWLVCISQHHQIMELQGRLVKKKEPAVSSEKQDALVRAVKEEIRKNAH